MKLTVFGATGRTGTLMVEQALEGGYQVKAFVRTPSKMKMDHRNLELVQGDVTDAEAVDRAVAGADAVLSVIGHTKDSPDDLQTRAMHNITGTMKKRRVKRIVNLTGAGVRDPEDRPKLIDKLIVALLKLTAGNVFKDGRDHVEVLRESGLEWTVVRAPRLVDGPRTGRYRVGFVGKDSATKISRADVADFMLKEVQERRYVRKLPMVSY
ncbi:MAG: NAD(P)-dependent oxidoreductase [Chitinispirillaceae bacterium]